MTVQEIAAEFAALCREGRHEEAGARFWSDDIVSIEAAEGPAARAEGRAALAAKHAWWASAFEMHGGTTEGPYVNGDQFALRFTMDVTERATGRRSQMAEVGLYTVRDGKVVEERFFYGS